MKLLATLTTILLLSAALACGSGEDAPGTQGQSPTLPPAATADTVTTDPRGATVIPEGTPIGLAGGTSAGTPASTGETEANPQQQGTTLPPAIAIQLTGYEDALMALPTAVMACAEGLTLDSPTTEWVQAVEDNIECIKDNLEAN